MSAHSSALEHVLDFSITVILWIYYILAYLVFLSPFYLYAFCFSNQREERFQQLNFLHYRAFFAVVRALVPRMKWEIPQEVLALRSSIIVSNHLSFLDPILFISLFKKHKTIVRSDFFKVPFFGWVLKNAGYLPSASDSLFSQWALDQLGGISDFLKNGGNFFIFPEGTRSRGRGIGPFNKGAFRIAKLCRAPIKVVIIRNTEKLFPPDRFLFNTRHVGKIELSLAGTIEPDYDSPHFSLASLMSEVRSIMERKEAQEDSSDFRARYGAHL